MPKPAKVALSIFGTIVAFIVIAGLVSPREGTTTSAASTTTTTRATSTPSVTPAPTTSAAPVALTPDDRFVAAVLDAGDLVGVGRSVCESIGAPGVTHAGLVADLGASKWGAAVAEAVVAAAEANLCPERHYAVPAPAAEPAPRPQPAAAQPAPRREPAPAPRPAREESSSGASYKNCAAARAAGAAPLHRGDPGYRAGLDRDDDGVACE